MSRHNSCSPVTQVRYGQGEVNSYLCGVCWTSPHTLVTDDQGWGANKQDIGLSDHSKLPTLGTRVGGASLTKTEDERAVANLKRKMMH